MEFWIAPDGSVPVKSGGRGVVTGRGVGAGAGTAGGTLHGRQETQVVGLAGIILGVHP